MSHPMLAAVLAAASLLTQSGSTQSGSTQSGSTQSGAPTFVPRPHLLRFAAEDVPALLAQLPQTAVGRLLAEPDVAAAFAAGRGRFAAIAARRAAVAEHVLTHEVALEPWLLGDLPGQRLYAALRVIDLADLARIEAVAVLPDGESQEAATAVLVGSTPRAEGRFGALFEQNARSLAGSPHWRSEPDAKFEGFPCHRLRLARSERAPEVHMPAGSDELWLLQLPGLFAAGNGDPAACGAIAPPPPRGSAGLSGDLDVAAYVAMFRRLGFVPPPLEAFGLLSVRRIGWRLRFAGPNVLDEIELEFDDQPDGLIPALLTGSGAPPAPAWPRGMLLQLRCAVDLPALLDALAALLDGALPADLRDAADKAFTGGLALGVAAPAGAGVNPRLYAALAIADEAALDRLLAAVLPADQTRKQVRYEGIDCTVLAPPGLPSALQPTFCRRDGALLLAESATSMRAWLQAEGRADDASAPASAPTPPGAAAALPTFDLRCDDAALYRTFHSVWLPLLRLLPPDAGASPLLAIDELPDPDVVVPHLGVSRAVLLRDGNRITLQQVGALGGPVLAALAMTWGPLLSGWFHEDRAIEQMEARLAVLRLEAVWPALEAFQQQHGRWPRDLGELVAAAKLPADALVIPGDPGAETVTLPAGDDRTVRSSFRYFPDPVAVDLGGETDRMLLIGITPRRFQRPMLTVGGRLPEVWGEPSLRPIDRFGN